jgi:hypothetical protein
MSGGNTHVAQIAQTPLMCWCVHRTCLFNFIFYLVKYQIALGDDLIIMKKSFVKRLKIPLTIGLFFFAFKDIFIVSL